jgi:hypothetical protein
VRSDWLLSSFYLMDGKAPRIYAEASLGDIETKLDH